MWPFPRRKREPERRSNWLAFDDLKSALTTSSGVVVNQTTAISHPAVYRCVDLNANTIGSFPVDCLVKRSDKRMPYPEPIWLRTPNDYQDFNSLTAESVASQDIYDAAFILKAVDDAGRLAGLSVLDPACVHQRWVDVAGKMHIVYDVTLYATSESPRTVRLAANEVLFIKAGLPIPGALRGVSPIAAAKETIGTGLAARQFGANFYGNGAHLSGVIEAPGQMSPEAAERLQQAFMKRHGGVSKSHALGILSGGAQFKPISLSPADAQALETQKYTDIQIAALFGVPAEYVTDIMGGANGYVTGLYQRQMMWYQTGLFSRITRNERAFSSLLPGGAYIKFNVDSWLRMDPEQRVAFYSAGQTGQWLTPNEIRALEDLNPLPGGDKPLKSVQWQNNQPKPAPPPPQPAPTDPSPEPAPAGSPVKEPAS